MAIKTPNIVLYHIPRCGGTWAKEAVRRSIPEPEVNYGRCKGSGELNDLGLYREHATPDGVRKEDKRGRLSICFIRNPITWYRSFWSFRVKTESYDPGFPPDLLMDDEYENFVHNVLDEYPDGFVTKLFQEYVGQDGSEVNFVGRQETLADDLVEAMTISGQEFNERRLRNVKFINVAGSHRKYTPMTEISGATKDRIKRAEEWVFDTFYHNNV